MVKNLPISAGDVGLIPGLGRSPEEATCYSIAAWKIPWTEKSGGPQFMEATKIQTCLSTTAHSKVRSQTRGHRLSHEGCCALHQAPYRNSNFQSSLLAEPSPCPQKSFPQAQDSVFPPENRAAFKSPTGHSPGRASLLTVSYVCILLES